MFDFQLSTLGKQVAVSEKYSPQLLFRVPREENRARYAIDSNALIFCGFDVWNCYEVSFLTNNGLPVQCVMKMYYSSENQYIVESKSLKLYLNSLNFVPLGKTVTECTENAQKIIKDDLEKLLETEVFVSFFGKNAELVTPFLQPEYHDLLSFIPENKWQNLTFEHFTEMPDVLCGERTEKQHEYAFCSDILRSNCRVTNQPDWGDLFVRIETNFEIDFTTVAKYLVSFRRENHFHEEVTEMIYKRLHDKFAPEKLMVATMYSRRGGIDINPIRASHNFWLDEAFTTNDKLLHKTWRQ